MSTNNPYSSSFTMGNINMSGSSRSYVVQGHNNRIQKGNGNIIIGGNVSDSIVGGQNNHYRGFQIQSPQVEEPDPVVEISKRIQNVNISEPGTCAATPSRRYDMDAYPRGHCLIINNVHFENNDVRNGSDVDAKELERLFTNLHFNVVCKTDLKASEMLQALKSLAQLDHRPMNAVIVAILSHGSQDAVNGIDGKGVELMSIAETLNNDNCRQLYGKPKLFFIQACRGELADGTSLISPDGEDIHQDLQSDAQPFANRVPKYTDMLLSYSTVDGFVAIRSEQKGSWYIQALIQSFKEKENEEIGVILNTIDMKVQQFVGAMGNGKGTTLVKQATSSKTIGWNKQLYFNP